MSFTFNLRTSASCLAFCAALLGSGCAAGPDFEPPVPPAVAAYDSEATPADTADGAQKLAIGVDIPAQWWQLYRSQPLNELIGRALAQNPDIAAAEAALRAANAVLSAESAAFLPAIDASFAASRQRVAQVSTGTASSIYSLHTASVSASYNVDLFGGTRRAVEQKQAAADVARFELEAARLALTGNVVAAAFQEASLREQVAAAESIVEKRAQLVAQTKARFDAGAVPLSDLVAYQAALASAKAALPGLRHQLSAQRHALSALAGDLPQTAPKATFRLDQLSLPVAVPLSVPSQLVAQRPDIRAAEETMHAASAAIGVARAARLPQISLSADLGSMAKAIGDLFSPGGGFWSLGASAAQSLFDAGALADKEDAAVATFDQSAALYRGAVLTAFQNVADALHALQSDAESLAATQDARKAAADTLALAKARFDAGAISRSDVLSAEIADLSAQSDLAKARAARFADTAALLVALGGGWWNRDQNSGLLIVGDDILIKGSAIVRKGKP